VRFPHLNLRGFPWPVSLWSSIAATTILCLIPVSKGSPVKPVTGFGQVPMAFEKNTGQTDSRFQFVARGTGHAIYLGAAEALVAFGSGASTREPAGVSPSPPRLLQFTFLGAATNVAGRGMSELPGKVNHITGRGPNEWTLGVPVFSKVSYQEVYPGIELVCYGNQESFEYDFVVAPGADANCISFQVDGADKMELDEQGDLVFFAGTGRIRQHKPVSYQFVDGERRPIDGRFSLKSSNVVTFALGSYDPKETLVIDPVLRLEYSSYLGGSKIDRAWALAVDASGNVYVGGETFAVIKNVPAHGFQTDFGGGTKYGGDGFVAKLDPTGTSFVYFTYLGGNSLDGVNGIAVDASGAAYVTGYTISTNFPVFPSTGVLQPDIGGTNIVDFNVHHSDAFVTKLDASGQPVYSTYLGGELADVGGSIAVDTNGNAVIAGYTESALAFRVTNEVRTLRCTNFFETNMVCGSSESVRTNVTTVRLIVPVTLITNVVLAEFTSPSLTNVFGTSFVARLITERVTTTILSAEKITDGFPLANAVQTNNAGGADLFVAKLSADGTSLIYSTYLGGRLSQDFGTGVGLDPAGNAVVSGVADDIDFPVANALQPFFAGGRDAVLAKFDTAGGLLYSTYLGGSLTDIAYGVAVDADGAAYVAGSEASKDFLTTAGAVRPGGVSKSTDAGTNWVLSSQGLTHTGVRSLTINPAGPSTLYAGTPRGVFITTDAGANWQPSGQELTSVDVTALAIDPILPSTLYAAGDLTLYKSVDSGFSWRPIGTGLPEKETLSLVLHPSDPTVLYAGTRTGLYLSEDGGTNFVQKKSGLGTRAIYRVVVDPLDPSVLYTGAEGGVFKSTDAGTSWKAFNGGLENKRVLGLALNPSSPSSLIAGTAKGIFRTTDSGTNWVGVTNGIGRPQVNVVLYDPSDSSVVYAGTTNGVFKSADAGVQWTNISAGLMARDFVALLVDPSNPLVVYTGARGTNFSGGTNDAFLVKLSPDGSTLEYGFTFGGTKTDEARAVAVDTNRSAFVTGLTLSKNFPVNGAIEKWQGTNSGNTDAFIAQFDPTGTSNIISVLFGGKRNDSGRAIALDGMGGVYIAGASDSKNLPVTNAVQRTHAGDKEDAFVAKFRWMDPMAEEGTNRPAVIPRNPVNLPPGGAVIEIERPHFVIPIVPVPQIPLNPALPAIPVP
jgi:photosystem II stability/assembly factor-like uncharacterized protein